MIDGPSRNKILESYMKLTNEDSCLVYYDNILTVKTEVTTEIQNTTKSCYLFSQNALDVC